MYIQKLATFAGDAKPRIETTAFGDVCVFEGYLSKPEVDTDNDLITMDAWAGVKAADVALCWQHKMDCPIGQWRHIEAKSDGLYGVGEINMGFELGKQAAALVRQGALSGLSVGFKADRGKISEKEMDVRGTRKKVRVIPKAELFECSVVTRPALNSARIAKSAELFRKLADAGLRSREIEEIVARYDEKSADDHDEAPVISLEQFAQMIAKATTLREFEAVLRDADLSRKERAAFVATHKDLLARCGLKLARDAEGGPEDDPIARDADAAKKAADEAAKKAADEAAANEAAEREAAVQAALAGLKGLVGKAVTDIKSL